MFVYDSHTYVKELTTLGVDETIAEVHAQQFKNIIQSDLATKSDIAAQS